MNASVLELPPPDLMESDREPLAPEPTASLPPARMQIDGLGAVASTLLIPLAARAHGDAMFPRVAVGDEHVRRVLARLGADVSPYLADRASVYGVLARTIVFRHRGQSFFQRHPNAIGVSLGAGLGHYFQWLDQGGNRWLDADLPEVTALRAALLPVADDRRLDVALDLAKPGWWRRLGLPGGRRGTPVFLICEGVLMYFAPEQVRSVLREFGEEAPPGSRLAFDVLHGLAVGRARRHPSVRHTGAQFHWGPRSLRELTAPHPRLRLDATYCVMDGYGLPFALLGSAFNLMFGVPFYAIAEIGVDA